MKFSFKGVILSFLISFSTSAQVANLSDDATVSLLTISPGTELYSSFGHSTILIEDAQNDVREMYNFGTFDFSTSGFYIKFLRGTLPYQLSKSPLDAAINYWTSEGRLITRQKLRFTQAEKQYIYGFLENNYQPENRTYQYKFFYDNCSTRLRDIINQAKKGKIKYDKNLNDDQTYRDWIDQYAGYKKVADFGMDIAIGMPSDEITGYDGAMYIPDNMMHAFDSATVAVDGRVLPLVYEKQVINSFYIQPQPQKKEIDLPLILSGLLLLTSLFFFFRPTKGGRIISISNRVLFTIVGLSGWIFFLLWFFTEHGVTTWNLNILWAIPPFFPLFLFKKPRTPKFYLIAAILAASTVLVDITQVQDIPLAADLIAVALSIRLFGIYRKLTETQIKTVQSGRA